MTRTLFPFDIPALTAFVHLARERNFTTVGRSMGITPSAVSKAIARLEVAVGAKLVTRSSRYVALTPEGVFLHERCHDVLKALEEAKRTIGDQHESPSGHLRVSLPEGFGKDVITPRLAEFVKRYPEIDLEIHFTDQRLELVEANIDVAVWTGPLPNSRLVARGLSPLQHITCASPAYLAAYGEPKMIDDLAGHVHLGVIAKRTGQLQPWLFQVDGKRVEHHLKPRVTSDSLFSLVQMAIDGIGIVQATDYSVAPAIYEGRLVPVLSKFSGASTPLNMVFPSNARQLRRVRAFADFMVDVVKERPRVTDEGDGRKKRPPSRPGRVSQSLNDGDSGLVSMGEHIVRTEKRVRGQPLKQRSAGRTIKTSR